MYQLVEIKNRKFRIDDANFESRIDQYYERYHDQFKMKFRNAS